MLNSECVCKQVSISGASQLLCMFDLDYTESGLHLQLPLKLPVHNRGIRSLIFCVNWDNHIGKKLVSINEA